MADKRINALATTAPNTASDDFFAVDGTTNGTRKLNAFSPTFGGNATVTGNLTVNGTGNSSFAGQLIQVADPATISLWKDATPTKAARFQFNTLADNGFSLGVYDGSSWFNAITVAPTTGVVKIPSSSASSSTITGALVVSGGVGVAGAIYAGGAVTVAGGSFAAASFYKSASLGTVLSGATGSSYDLYLTNPAGNYVMQVPTGTRNAEFAATLTTVGAITSGASISTSAPVGGAGAWELGVYSSTAPSATGYVTIEIGGTVYKLLASNV